MDERSNGKLSRASVTLWREPLDAKSVPQIKGEVFIDEDLCKECGYCIEFCPAGVLSVSPKRNKKGYHPPQVQYPDKCTGCGFCERVCPEFAIVSKKLVLEGEK